MVKSDSGFRLLINRLKAYGDTNQVVEILYSPEISPDLRADRFSQWADLDPENKFVQRCATRSLIAAGRHREAQNQLQRWLLWDSHGAEPNALLSETYRHMKRADLADSCAHRANLAAQDDLMSTPGFIRISACPDIRDFARAFREKHGCPYHIEESGQSLIHFHHWRTGGTTLRDCFQNLFDPSQVFVFGDFRDPYLKSRQELLDAAVEIRREFQFVSIHHALPAHYFFPTSSPTSPFYVIRFKPLSVGIIGTSETSNAIPNGLTRTSKMVFRSGGMQRKFFATTMEIC